MADDWCGQRSQNGRFPTVLINLYFGYFGSRAKRDHRLSGARLKRSEPFLAKRRSHPTVGVAATASDMGRARRAAVMLSSTMTAEVGIDIGALRGSAATLS